MVQQPHWHTSELLSLANRLFKCSDELKCISSSACILIMLHMSFYLALFSFFLLSFCRCCHRRLSTPAHQILHTHSLWLLQPQRTRLIQTKVMIVTSFSTENRIFFCCSYCKLSSTCSPSPPIVLWPVIIRIALSLASIITNVRQPHVPTDVFKGTHQQSTNVCKINQVCWFKLSVQKQCAIFYL